LNIFLTGPRRIGKSYVINQILTILSKQAPLKLGGFFTWREGENDPHIYMKPAQVLKQQEVFRLASYNKESGSFSCDLQVFEKKGVALLTETADVDLLLMDELGFLESKAPAFCRAVMTALAATTPVLGVLREGNIPWLQKIRHHALVTLYDVNKNNREELPLLLAAQLTVAFNPPGIN